MNDWYSKEELHALHAELKAKLEVEFGREGIVVLWTAQNMMRLANGETTSALLKEDHELYVIFPDEATAVRRGRDVALAYCKAVDDFVKSNPHYRMGTSRLTPKRDTNGAYALFLAFTPPAKCHS